MQDITFRLRGDPALHPQIASHLHEKDVPATCSVEPSGAIHVTVRETSVAHAVKVMGLLAGRLSLRIERAL